MEDLIKVPSIGAEVHRDRLMKVSFEDLLKDVIALGYIYYFPKFGKPKLLLSAGEAIANSLLEKFHNLGKSEFYVYPLANKEFINMGFEILQELRSRSSEQEKFKAKEQFKKLVVETFWRGERSGSLLDLIILFNRVFYQQDNLVTQECQSGSLIIYNRSFRVAAFSTSVAIFLDYLDFDFLKDFYNVNLLLDYGLFNGNFSYSVLEALEREQKQGGSGLEYLHANGGSVGEADQLHDHPRVGYEKLKQFFDADLTYPELLKIILTHHENEDGSGFPLGVSHREINEFEAISILADHIFPFQSYVYNHDDGKRLFWDLVNQFSNSKDYIGFPVKRVMSKLENTLPVQLWDKDEAG